jgi:hypothetical protein
MAVTGADARAHWLTRARVIGYARIFVAIYLLSAIAWVAMSTDLVDVKGKPLGYDFITFWAGSFLALSGEAATSFDMARIFAIEQLAVPANQSVFLWHYPPTFHLVVLPLALMPYLAAYTAWTAASFVGYATVVRRFVPRSETLWVLAAFPGAFINAFHGQNGFLTAALFGAAVLQLETRPILAGVLFGLMSWKPQLGVLIPIALLCARQWGAFAAAAVTTLTIAALSLIAFGAEPWIAFWHNIPLVGVLLDTGTLPWPKIPSLYVALRTLGVGVTLAHLLHMIAAFAVIACIVVVWRGAAPLRLRGAVLVIGALLMPPYLFDYDLALLAIPIAILAWDGLQRGWRPYEREILVAAWLTPLAAPGIAEHLGIPLAWPILLSLFVVAVRRARNPAPPARD